MELSRQKQTAKYNGIYAGIHAFYWMGFGAVWSYIAVILSHDGFTNTEIGLVTSLATLLSIVVQPALSARADRSRRIGARETAFLLLLLDLLLTAVLLLFPKTGHTLTAATFMLLGLSLSMVPPFFNSLAMDLLRRGVGVNYGLGRGIGSLCYAFAVVAVGFLVERYSPRLTLPFFAGFTVLDLLFVLLCRLPAEPACDAGAPRGKALGTLPLLRRTPALAIAMAAGMFAFAGHTVFNTYFNAIVARCGAGESVMGLALGIAAAMELPAMSLFPRFRRRFRCETLLCVSGFFFLLKTALFLLTDSVPMLYVNAVLQFFEHGIYVPATVYFASEYVDDANQVKGQGLIYIGGYGFGNTLGNLIGGWCVDRFTITGALWYAVLSTAVGFALFLLCAAYLKRTRNAPEGGNCRA